MSAGYPPLRPTPVNVDVTPSISRARLVDVRFRSVGSLLFAYAARLSRGDFFLETPRPFPTGTRLSLRLQAPVAAPLRVEGSVVWTRPIALGPGQPSGMGIALSPTLDVQGAIIDDLVARFRGIRVLVVGAHTAARSAIARRLRSMLACDILEMALPTDMAAVAEKVDAGLDLAFVDLDGARQAATAVINLLTNQARTAGLPVVALAAHEQDRAGAAALGVSEVLETPAASADIKMVVTHALGSPTSWDSP